MIYTDGIHVTADSIDELYKYANTLKLDTDSIVLMGKNIHPHFTVTSDDIKLVLEDANVQKVTVRELVKLCQLNFRLPDTNDELQEWENYHRKSISDLNTPSEAEYDRMLSNILKRVKLD